MDYFDANLDLTEEDLALKAAAHKFASEVIRPTAKALDEMTPEAVIAAGSPLWPFLRKAYELGYHKMLIPEQVGGMGLNPLQVNIVMEEMGWGSFGLAVQLAVCSFVPYTAAFTGNEELIREFTLPYCACTDASLRSCWGGTEPGHGSDNIGMGEAFFYQPNVRTDCLARREGDEWVINGQKAAWVSGGTIATHCQLHCQTDPSLGLAGFSIFLLPLDLPGVSKGKPLNKLGQRDLNQGELFFDDVRVPDRYRIIGPDMYGMMEGGILALANAWMASWATGLARAAFEEAFAYCKERVQGGRPLAEHYSIKQRIFEMFTRVETCRALTRAAVNLNLNIAPGFPEYSMAAKITATRLCLENASDAIQLLGGNGLSKEYLPEKLFRDARATLIEDGNNEVLARHGGHTLFECYPRPRDTIPRIPG
jgi:alkylation response protein AidB-like acyl-CoA dehydrogenase